MALAPCHIVCKKLLLNEVFLYRRRIIAVAKLRTMERRVLARGDLCRQTFIYKRPGASLTMNENGNLCRYTWSQFIDLISNRIIVNGSERSKVLSASTLRLLITQEEIHFCSLEHDGGGASAAAQKFMPFSVFLLSMARCRIALLARFFSGSFEDKVNIQINWYFSCFSVGSEEAFDFFS